MSLQQDNPIVSLYHFSSMFVIFFSLFVFKLLLFEKICITHANILIPIFRCLRTDGGQRNNRKNEIGTNKINWKQKRLKLNPVVMAKMLFDFCRVVCLFDSNIGIVFFFFFRISFKYIFDSKISVLLKRQENKGWKKEETRKNRK